PRTRDGPPRSALVASLFLLPATTPPPTSTLSLHDALPISRLDKLRRAGQRRLALSRQLDVRGQDDRQVRLRHGHNPARVAVNDRNRRAPVTLPRNSPVLDAIPYGPLAEALRLRVARHALDGLFRGEPRIRPGIDQ